MSFRSKFLYLVTLLGIVPLFLSQQTFAQNSTNAYQIVEGWAKLPGGRLMGAVGKAVVDNDGRHVWAVIRCDAPQEMFGRECVDSDLDPILKFDPDGNVVESFGGGECLFGRMDLTLTLKATFG